MRESLKVSAAITVLFLSACAAEIGPAGEDERGLDSNASELTAGSPPLPSAVQDALQSPNGISADVLDHLFTLEHFVPVGPDRRIHVTETFTIRAWLRFPHRAMLMLPGPLTHGDIYNVPVEGYQGRERMAKRGFFALSADFEGSGLSTFPVDGRSVSQDLEIAAMRKVVEYFRRIRLVPRVDLLGESWGGGVAAELCAEPLRLRSCTMGSMLYQTASELADQTFRSPGFRAFLDSLPDGYWTTTADAYVPIVGLSPPEVRQWANEHEPGRYATRVLYDAFDLPSFDPTRARVPGLVIEGEFDPIRPPEDSVQLARDYGSHGAQLVVVQGAGHVPRLEPPPHNETYWNAVTSFVDP